ncbi:uncharacterized protein VDAG_09215 [Verticillium dahliae VdLs.17]|uniref:Protein kinase domain-containing protein n=1 Tax=Verticillium dahliae (strain VdLs.17 / ATCC MYA-4575 / FGSC 10137) TaxID=498257 RepID=G2XFU1_VERDV|nr:uncharacterized protein VDAG_09215 [Verticillium dahliae VdLs.17]EGY18689.1 hypothetical protein VDAG_09215 [Verticillium dahliae VdLs.17]KAH6708560.1 hypothetical protein EV126DRAFT_409338 [Verticillium dahliae]
MSPLEYFVESYLTSDKDDDCEITVRRNGKLIYLRLSPLQFQESPEVEAYYFKCLNVLKSGEEVIDDLYDDEAQEWLVKPFEPLMAQFATEPPGGLGIPTLAKYFFADYLVLTLDVKKEELRPRRVETQTPPRIPWVWISDELAHDLEGWTTIYPPSQVEIYYDRPQDVLIRLPRRVHVNDGKDTYFFKPFCVGGSREEVSQELKNFKQIAMANLGPKARVCRLHGVVGDGDQLLGMLLTFVEERLPLHRARAFAPSSLRQQWAAQIKDSLAALHKAGLVWGDVKPHNVLIDAEDNAWLIDFGGSYTEGWVDRQEAGTVEGDLHGLARILEFLS